MSNIPARLKAIRAHLESIGIDEPEPLTPAQQEKLERHIELKWQEFLDDCEAGRFAPMTFSDWLDQQVADAQARAYNPRKQVPT